MNGAKNLREKFGHVRILTYFCDTFEHSLYYGKTKDRLFL